MGPNILKYSASTAQETKEAYQLWELDEAAVLCEVRLACPCFMNLYIGISANFTRI